MKMTAEKDNGGGKLSSWKIYYGVLSNGFLILYKDNYSKTKVKKDQKDCYNFFFLVVNYEL